MRAKTLFLAKTLSSSLVLFLLWPYLAKGYGFILVSLIQLLDPARPELHEKWPYIASLFLIPLISLTISTPGLGKRKMAAILGVGVGSSLVLDLLKLQYGIGDDGNYLVWYSIYHTLKWLVPLVAWVSFCYPLLDRMLREKPETGSSAPPLPRCPLCDAPQQDMALHIRNSHGERALKIKKVRRFFAEEKKRTEQLCL